MIVVRQVNSTFAEMYASRFIVTHWPIIYYLETECLNINYKNHKINITDWQP